jgi:UDP-2,4-diacetamido-2,4,6-trideoxy-beta-L-altropyranose hydrolase
LPDRHGSRSDLQETTSFLKSVGPGWVALDGYRFDARYQREIRQRGHRLLVIDDNAHLDRYEADILVNQNLYARELHYSTRPETKLLLGPDYFLLRREFQPTRAKRETPVFAEKILVTLGAMDPENVTLKVLKGMDRLRDRKLQVTALVGPDNPHLRMLEKHASGSPHGVGIVVDPPAIAPLMLGTDLAVSGGGTTLGELAHMGVPTLAVIVAENQRMAVAAWERDGIVRTLGEGSRLEADAVSRGIFGLASDGKARERMSEKGRTLVDGRGAERIINNLLAFSDQGL